MPRRQLIVALAGTALALAAHGASAAEASAPAPASPTLATTGADLAARADGIADEAVARWALLQRADGRFPDPVAGSGEDYGTAMLGLAMARRGAAHGDRALVSRGLDAVLAEVERPTNGAFEPLVLADAYRWGMATLAGDAELRDLWASAEPRLQADLIARQPAGVGTVAARCLADDGCWNNLKLVGALAGQTLLDTDLTSTTPGALLADPKLATSVLRVVRRRVPAETGRGVRRRGAAALAGAGILSDPTRDPLAYHALSTALLGRLVDELGAAAPPDAVAALDRASRALLLLAAPDGDLTWWGRGQGQVWVPAIAAEAAARAALRASPNGDLRGRYLALAGTELARLRRDYGVGAIGMPLVPGAVDAGTLRARGVDDYATTRGYNGLAVDALDRAASLLRQAGGRVTSLPSMRSGAVRSATQAGVATLTRGGRWVAISGRARAVGDARYGSGLLALEARDQSGDWSGRVPQRPDSAAVVATLAVRDGDQLLPAAGAVLPGRSSDSITVLGQWAAPGGGHALDSGTRWRWTLGADGALAASFRLSRRRTVVASALAAGGDAIRVTPAGVTVVRADGSTVRYTLRVGGRPASLGKTPRALGASAYDDAVRAYELTATGRAHQVVTLTVRAAGAPPIVGG